MLGIAFLIVGGISLIVGSCIWGISDYLCAFCMASLSLILLRCRLFFNVVVLVFGAIICKSAFWFAYVLGLVMFLLCLMAEAEDSSRR
jgi:hypothetical protein